ARQRCVGAARRRVLSILFIGSGRQVDPDRRSLARLAVKRDMSAGLLEKAIDRAQTEAGSVSDWLGGEEGFERPLPDLIRHAGAGVAHGDHDIPARPDIGLAGGVILIELRL